MPPAHIPYCGSSPVPGTLAWNLDPILMLVLAIMAALHLALAKTITPGRRAAAGAGWLILGLALVSPLCNLSVALFSARVAQHMILTLLAAPLIVLALPSSLVRRLPAMTGLSECMLAAAAFAAMLWIWHMPGPYDATLKNDGIYWLMHVSLFGSSLWLWRVLLDATPKGMGAALVVSLFTGIQMSILGAVLTFSPRALFAVHSTTTGAWGFSALQDQQLGGLIMWVPGGLLLTGYALFAFGLHLHRIGEKEATVHR